VFVCAFHPAAKAFLRKKTADNRGHRTPKIKTPANGLAVSGRSEDKLGNEAYKSVISEERRPLTVVRQQQHTQAMLFFIELTISEAIA